jgi:hypothetical protein
MGDRGRLCSGVRPIPGHEGPDGLLLLLLLSALGSTPGGSSTVHIYTQTVHRIQRMEHA